MGLAAQCFGQSLGDTRDQLRNSLRNADFAATFTGLIVLSDELELSGASYKIDDDKAGLSSGHLRSTALPFRKQFDPWEKTRTRLYVEGVLGYGKYSRTTSDIYSGLMPGMETSIDSDSTTLGGLVGIGAEFRLIEGLTLTPIVNAGLAYIKNDVDYGGPGADTSAAILDGLAFNWDGWTATGGGAFRINWVRPLGKGYKLETVGRYDIRWTDTFNTDSSAQEFSSRFQLLMLRTDITGPTGMTPFDRTLYWRVLAGYRHFLEGSLYDIQNIVLLGGGLEYDVTDMLPVGTRLTVKGGVILGENISGYTLGAGLSF